MSGLALEGVAVAVGDRVLLGPLDLVVAPGEVLSILGPSGSGKSSLLSYLCGVLPAPLRGEGRVWLDGRDISGLPPERRGLGILFQDDLLFPHLSVGANLAFGLRNPGGRKERRQVIAAALAGFALTGYEPRDPATLSGGERSRVALLRVLLSAPRALFLDEPFGRLDPATRDSVRSQTFAEIRARRIPAVLVSHDAEDVAAAGGRVIRIGCA